MKDKTYAITATYDGAIPDNTIERKQRNMVAEPIGIAQRGRGEPAEQQIEARTDGKTNAVTTVGKDSMVAEPICVNSKSGRGDKNNLQPSVQNRIYDISGKGTAATGGFRTSVAVPMNPTSNTDGKEHTVYEVKDGQITIKGKTYPIKLIDGYYIIRKLTVRECMRLQTVPEWYEFPVSNSQAYKMLGNGWTCEVITHLIKACLSGKAADEQIRLI